MYCNLINLPMDDGIKLVNRLFPKCLVKVLNYNFSRFTSLLIELGIEPVIWLLYKYLVKVLIQLL
jgi:hypothetical protein